MIKEKRARMINEKNELCQKDKNKEKNDITIISNKK